MKTSVVTVLLAALQLQHCNAWTTSSSARLSYRLGAARGCESVSDSFSSRRGFFAKTSAAVAAASLIVSSGSVSPVNAADDEIIDVYFGCGKFCITQLTSSGQVSAHVSLVSLRVLLARTA